MSGTFGGSPRPAGAPAPANQAPAGAFGGQPAGGFGQGQGQAQGGFGGPAQQQQQQQHGQGGFGGQPAGQGGGSFARRAGPPPDEAVPNAGRPSDMGEPGSSRTPQKPPSGTSDQYAYMDSIIKWPTGTAVEIQLHAPGQSFHRYSVRWDMTPSPETLADEEKFSRWRAYRSDAFSLGGFTEGPNPAIGWPGWEQVGDKLVPPYYDFFVRQIGNFYVPVMLAVRIDVSRFVNIVAVGHARDQNGGAVYQAPMPRKLCEWIAVRHGWRGAKDVVVMKAREDRPEIKVPVFIPDKASIPFPAQGMIGGGSLPAFYNPPQS